MRIGIIGAGSVGSAVGVLLQEKGHDIVGVASRSRKSAAKLALRLGKKVFAPHVVAAKADVLLLTVNDGAIADVTKKLAEEKAFRAGQVVVHFSGSLPAEIMAPARDFGAVVVSVHPLQSCAGIERAIKNLPGSVFSIEGDKEAFETAEKIVTDLGGKFFYIDGKDKMLYHAAAVFISNYAVTLADISKRILQDINIPPELGLEGMLTLLKGTLANLETFGTPQALTGPIARGDGEVVRQHLEHLKRKLPELTAVYEEMALETVKVALAKESIDGQKAQELRDIIRGNNLHASNKISK